MDTNKIIIGRFDKKENFGFLVPEDKDTYKSDFFVALRNSIGAQSGDLVEALEIKGRGKSREAKIVKIFKNSFRDNTKYEENINDKTFDRKKADSKNFDKKYNDKKSDKKIVENRTESVNKVDLNKKLDENNIVGIFSQGKGDFGFIDVEGIEKGFFVFSNNKNSALDGDKVEASVKTFNGKQEATIVRVLERKLELIVGEFRLGKTDTYGFVIPSNPSVKTDIFVAGKKSMDAKAGDIVGVLVTNWTGKNPEGTIKEIIGKKGDKKIEVLGLIVEGGARIKFNEEVLKFAEKNPQSKHFQPMEKGGEQSVASSPLIRGELRGVGETEGGRIDLTNLFTFTIDGEDAKDLDDAISIEKLDVEGYKLYVHIADVAEYVTEQNPLDIEAYKRATSIYLVDRVIPMLPEKLSNDLCSLNPHTEKLTLTCEMIIGNNGKIKSSKVYESIINSDFRLTYKEVDEILDEKIIHNDDLLFSGKITNQLIESLQISDELKEKITKYRNSTGVLNFDFPETKILLNDEGNPISIKEYLRFDSNKLIEEFMISANEAVSTQFSNLPFLYRIHDEPKEDDLAKLQDTLNLFGVKFIFKNADTKEFDTLLKEISKLEEGTKHFLEKSILRTLSKAVYSDENTGHFGLGLTYYSHFTSPIRRYPDLQIHRIIKEKLNNKLDKERLIHYKSILDEVGKHTSEKERKAEKLEYKVRDFYIVQYYKNKVGEEFEGIITGVLPKGFFVALKDTAEGFVEMNNTQYVDVLKEHLDLFTGKKYRLGDKVNVKLVEVDESLLRLNFKVI